jgi:hypothetical protein
MKEKKEPLKHKRRASELKWRWPGEAVDARNISVAELIERHPFTRRLGINETLFVAQSQWRNIVGRTLNGLSEPMAFDDAKGILRVRVRGSAAKSDLTYQTPTVLKVMADLVGDAVVKEVKYVVV